MKGRKKERVRSKVPHAKVLRVRDLIKVDDVSFLDGGGPVLHFLLFEEKGILVSFAIDRLDRNFESSHLDSRFFALHLHLHLHCHR